MTKHYWVLQFTQLDAAELCSYRSSNYCWKVSTRGCPAPEAAGGLSWRDQRMTLGDCISPLLELLDRRWLSAQLISRFRPRGVACLRRLSNEEEGAESRGLEGGIITTPSSVAVDEAVVVRPPPPGELWRVECSELCWGDGVFILLGGEAGDGCPSALPSRGSLLTDVAGVGEGEEKVLLQSLWCDLRSFSHSSLCCRSWVICSSYVVWDFSNCSICCNNRYRYKY